MRVGRSGQATYRPYVPRRLLAKALEAEAGEGTVAFDGALLFTDIVGSTAMTDRFAARGPREVERLSAVLNGYFAACIAAIERHGGEVARIDGDAIIAVWPAGDDPVGAAGRAAAAAAGLARPVVAPVTGEAAIRHRLAVDFGSLRAFTLGSPGARRFLVLMGSPLTRMAAGALRGDPGQVLISRQAARLVREGQHRPLPACPPAASRGGLPEGWMDFVPPPVRAHGGPRNVAWLPEFRRVAAGYLKLNGNQGDLSRLTRAYGIAQSVLDEAGLLLSDVIAGDKGVVFKLTCGLPPQAREDNGLSAAAALERVQAALREAGEPSAAGLASGPVFCGVVGGPTRREYIAIGSAMNYGARLMQAAGRGLLCDSAMAQQIARVFDLGPSRDLTLPGRAAPLRVRRVTGRASPRPAVLQAGPPLAGRRVERLLIEERLDASATGSARPLLVEGEPGVGKSRLLAHATGEAMARGFRVTAVAAHPLARSTPFGFWRAAIPSLYGAKGLRRSIEAALADHPEARRLELLQDVLPHGFDTDHTPIELEGAARREAIESLLVTLVRRAPGPCCLIIDDLQWLDAASADVLRRIVAAADGPLVMAAARAGPVTRWDAVFSAEDRLSLDRLDAEAAAEFVCGVLEVERLSRRLADHIWRRSEGLPLHAAQLALALRDSGQIAVSGRRCRILASPLETAGPPATLQGLVLGRVDRLDGDERVILKVASAIGRPFEPARLADLEPMPRRRMTAALARLVADGFLQKEEGGRLTFAHALVRESVYELLTFDQRARLHAALAQGLEQRATAMAGYDAAEIAEHWERADQPANAIEHRLLAAEFALTRYANEDALEHLARAETAAAAAGLARRAGQPLRLLKLRGDALQELSRLDEAAATYLECARALGLRVPASSAGRLAEIASRLAARAVRSWAGRLMSRSPPASERDQLAAHLHMRIAEHAYFTNDALGVLHGTVAALDHAERAGSSREITLGYGGLAIGFGIAGLDRLARASAARCLAAAQTGGRFEEGLAHLMCAVHGFSAGHWVETAAHCREGAVIFADLGETFRRQSCEAIGAFVAVATGEVAQAERAFAAYGPLAEAVENAPVRAWMLAGRATLDIARSRAPTIEAATMDGVDLGDLHAGERLIRLGLVAALRLRQGDLAAAAGAAEAGLSAMLATAPTIGIGFVAIPQIADVLAGLAGSGEPVAMARARAACRAVEAYARKIPAARPRAELAGGRLALAEGRPALARRRWRRGLAVAEGLNMPLEAALCRSALAEVEKLSGL